MERLQQAQLACTGHRFGALLDLELAKDFLIVSLHGVQGEDQPLAHLLIREPLRHDLEDFQLAWAEWLNQRLGRRGRRPSRWSFALVLLCFKGGEHLPGILRHPAKSRGFGQEVRHGLAFVDKEPDEAARLGERERIQEQVHCLVLVPLSLESDRHEHQHLESFILPPPGLHLLSPGSEHRQCRGGVALGQVDPSLAQREIVGLRQMSGGCQVGLAKQHQHLHGSNFRDTIHQVVLARGLAGLGEQSGRPSLVAQGQFQADEHYLTGHPFVGVFELARQVDALLPVLRGFLQVVPFAGGG